jgi:hypothetical protein
MAVGVILALSTAEPVELPAEPWSSRSSRSDLLPALGRLSVTRQVLANVATPEQDRAGDDAPVTRSGTTGREAGRVRAVDRPWRAKRGGLPDRRHQPPNRDTLALRPHNHQQQREVVALCTGDQHTRAGDLSEVPVRQEDLTL